MPTPIVIVEDDAPLRETLVETLTPLADGVRASGITQAATAAAAREAHAAGAALMVLDLGLPDADGADLCRQIRARDAAVPILVVTARDGEDDKVALLESGADDYVTKPFSPAELRARAAALLRRAARDDRPQGDGAIIRVGPIVLDRWRRRLTRDGVEQRLTPIEWKLLDHLAAHPGEAQTTDALFRSVWDREFGDAALHVRVRVTYLRRKIEPDPAHPVLVRTVQGVGYMFVPPA